MPTVKISGSSYIDTVELEGDRLRVLFKSGRVYEHSGASPAVFDELVKAPSAGAYYNANIRNALPYEKLSDDAIRITTDDSSIGDGRFDNEKPDYNTTPPTDGTLEA